VEVTRRDRLALVGELVSDVSHECNNQLAFVLSNLQNLAEYADELAQLVTDYRTRVTVAGLRDPELAKMETEMDLEFLLQDAGRAAREGLEGAARLRDVLRTLSRLGADEPSDPQLIDLVKTVRHAASFKVKTVGIRAHFDMELLDTAPAFVSAALITRALVVMVKDGLAAFGARPRVENRMKIVLTRGAGRYALRVEHNGTDKGSGLAIAQEAAELLGGELTIEDGRTTLYVPEPEV
jgi:signal transduction histidine kinase